MDALINQTKNKLAIEVKSKKREIENDMRIIQKADQRRFGKILWEAMKIKPQNYNGSGPL
jgi:hypothetical protein